MLPVCAPALVDLSPRDVSPPGAVLSVSSLHMHAFSRKTSEGSHGQGGPPRAQCSDGERKGADSAAQEGFLEEVVLSYMVAHTQWLISARALRKAPQLCYLDAALKEHRMRPCHAALGLGSYRHPCSEASIQQVLTGPCCIGVRLEGPGGGDHRARFSKRERPWNTGRPPGVQRCAKGRSGEEKLLGGQ